MPTAGYCTVPSLQQLGFQRVLCRQGRVSAIGRQPVLRWLRRTASHHWPSILRESCSRIAHMLMAAFLARSHLLWGVACTSSLPRRRGHVRPMQSAAGCPRCSWRGPVNFRKLEIRPTVRTRSPGNWRSRAAVSMHESAGRVAVRRRKYLTRRWPSFTLSASLNGTLAAPRRTLTLSTYRSASWTSSTVSQVSNPSPRKASRYWSRPRRSKIGPRSVIHALKGKHACFSGRSSAKGCRTVSQGPLVETIRHLAVQGWMPSLTVRFEKVKLVARLVNLPRQRCGSGLIAGTGNVAWRTGCATTHLQPEEFDWPQSGDRKGFKWSSLRRVRRRTTIPGAKLVEAYSRPMQIRWRKEGSRVSLWGVRLPRQRKVAGRDVERSDQNRRLSNDKQQDKRKKMLECPDKAGSGGEGDKRRCAWVR